MTVTAESSRRVGVRVEIDARFRDELEDIAINDPHYASRTEVIRSFLRAGAQMYRQQQQAFNQR